MSGVFDSFRSKISSFEFGGSGSNNNDNDDPENQEQFEDEESQDSSWTEELSMYCPQLTFQERLIGFACSFSLGYLIAFFSFRFFIKLVEGNPIPFAINYTVGHILQLLSSMFLAGPQRQFRLMFDATRYMTSMVYLGCLAATLVLLFIPMPRGLKLLLLVTLTLCQFLASCWYTLSYIPYGRRTALRITKKALGIQGDYSIANVLT
uniref:Vesicle transport protein n=1 Tax=Entomoneis paludosa TaxID=265537 RepID=A0A7S3DMN6_9STRA|mmetsp:Transcript_21208/g.44319  ORF Transcript_21208/g.44319 Transcript_21208/m.44319 type:complete len:207 (+) Transcript_21208:102-722(+)